MKLKKKLILLVLISVLPVIFIAPLYYAHLLSTLQSNTLELESQAVALKANTVQNVLRTCKSDILFLSKLYNLKRLINAKVPQDIEGYKTALQEDFLYFSEDKHIYYQIRYIDESGQEVVRVDSDSKGSYVVANEKLQDKKNRYYFKDSMGAPKGGVFISPLDLNIERGKIENRGTKESPSYVPVIRYGTPIFDNANRPKGIVITNIYADCFLRDIESAMDNSVKTILINSDGYYLFHPDKHKEWGFMFSNNQTIQSDYNDSAQALLSGKANQLFKNREYVLTYEPIYLAEDYFWVIASIADKEHIFQGANKLAYRTLYAMLVALGLIVLLCFLIIRAILNPLAALYNGVKKIKEKELDYKIDLNSKDEFGEVAEAFNNMGAELKKFYGSLDEKVKERTREVEEKAAKLREVNVAKTLLNYEIEAKNAELQKLDRLKSDFVSTVSHELRTPLSITKEGISLVLDNIAGEINEKQQKILTTAKDNIDRLARIINDLLDISKIESQKVDLRRDLVNISDIIEHVKTLFKEKAKAKDVTIKLNLFSDKIEVYADADKMIQVFTNLVANAMKFTEKGCIEISAKDKKDYIECSVRDTGKGISEEDLPKVFDKFQQFGRVAGPGDKGTGLGLSIVKGIVQMHGGDIRVDSKLDAGTEFTFAIPKYSSDYIFKEYADAGMKKADSNNAQMSLFIVSVGGFDVLKKKFSEEKLRGILDGLKASLKASLRGSEDAVAKDTCEIILVLDSCDKEGALSVSKRLNKALETYLEKENLAKEIRVKIGFSTYPEDANAEKELVDIARRR